MKKTTPAVAVPVPSFRECCRCHTPITMGQSVRTLSTDVKMYVAHLDCPEHE